MKREPIDFHYIPEELRWIDELLVNWARWQHGGLVLALVAAGVRFLFS